MSTPWRVLVVDDSLTVRMDLADLFAEAGHEVVAAATLAEATAAVGAGPIDLLLLDVHLPDGDGLDWLAAHALPAAVIILAEPAEAAHRLPAGLPAACLSKPYDPDEVLARAADLVPAGAAHGAAAPTPEPPLATVDAGAAAPTPEPPPASVDALPPGPRRTLVLVIDDSPTFREALRDRLEAEGYDVEVAETGEAGLAAATARPPAAAVVDRTLPGIDGGTVIARMRSQPRLRTIPTLLLTADEGREAELAALEAGADAYVLKSHDIGFVMARLAALLRAAAPAPDAPSHEAVAQRILAVDDSPTYLNALADQLASEGFEVQTATSGEEALALLAHTAVDCILLDMVMPGLSGPETCVRIKADPRLRQIPLAILSVADDPAAMTAGLYAGADDYIVKSNDFEVIMGRVRAQLRRKGFEEENRRIREELMRQELEMAEARAAKELSATRERLLADLERKNAELTIATTRAEEATRAKSMFLANMSHELRTPLNAILGYSDMLMEEAEELGYKTFVPDLKKIGSAGRQLLDLINDILDLSKVEAGKMDVYLEQLDPRDLVGELESTVLPLIKRKQNTLALELGASLPILLTDGARLRQVLLNLLSNAAKFTEGGKVTLAAEATPEGVCFKVTDSGIGMTPDQLAKLFQDFTQVDASTTRKYGGTGLGLAISKRFVELLGGHIVVTSEAGQGSTFAVHMPLVSPSQGDGLPAADIFGDEF